MIKPKTSTKTTKGKGLAEKMKKAAKQTNGAYFTVGVHSDAGQYPDGTSVAEVAAWNEFGTETIPARPFLGDTVKEQQGNLAKWRTEALKKMSAGEIGVAKGLEMIAFRLAEKVINKIKSDMPPPNAARTVADKKSRGVAPRTLIDSTLLLRSIGYRVFVPKGSPSGEGGGAGEGGEGGAAGAGGGGGAGAGGAA